MSSSTKAQISFEFYAAVSALLLIFLSSIVFTVQIKRGEEDGQIRIASLMLAQKIANSADLMQRNLCRGVGCSISLALPSKIKGPSFSKEVDYNISFSSNWVVLTPQGYPPVSVAASMPLEGLRVSLEQKEDSKLLRMEGS